MTHATAEDWYTLDTLTFLDCGLYDATRHAANATMKIIEGYTQSGEVVEVVYYAEGDYEDRWVDVTGKQHTLIFWRPCRSQ